jgi:hypothetical protein
VKKGKWIQKSLGGKMKRRLIKAGVEAINKEF